MTTNSLLMFLSLLGGYHRFLRFVAADDHCSSFSNCDELYSALISSPDGTLGVCASNIPIVCDETMGQMWFNDPSNPPFKLQCIASGSTCGRCIIDYTPTAAYDGSSSYGGFVLQQQNELIVDGFEFKGLRGSGRIFSPQEGSRLTIRNCVFEE